jgi:hypothetical protein
MAEPIAIAGGDDGNVRRHRRDERGRRRRARAVMRDDEHVGRDACLSLQHLDLGRSFDVAGQQHAAA